MTADGSPEGETARDPARSKVGRLIREHDMDGMDEALERMWTDEGEERYSLRQLADYFNQQLLAAKLAAVDERPLEGEVENTYRLLTDDDVSGGVRTQTENTLARSGIDVDALRTDFVSHQAIHTYLTKYRRIEPPSNDSDEEQVEKGLQTIRRLQNRTLAVTESTLSNLDSTERIDVGDLDVFVDIRVVCNDCGSSFDVDELLRNGACNCSP